MSRLVSVLRPLRSRGRGSALLSIAVTASIGAGCLTPQPAPQPQPDRRGEIWDAGDRGKLLTIGVFDDYNEILRGTTATDRHLGLHYFDLKGLVSGIRCIGHGRVTQMPADAEPGVRCEGIGGVSTLTCTDGRTVETEYKIEPDCSVGWGLGTDQYGNTLSFVYGLPEERAEEVVRREMRQASRRAPLETYKPSEVRAERGFSTGTAFAIDGEGHFVTSHHVVADTDRIWIVDAEGEEHPITYVRGDAENDVALLKAEGFRANGLPVRRAETLRKGDRVIALGYPLVSIQGQEQKATFGRVNALSGAMGDERFLQVDAPIQPGNSGGPLLDRRGNVVGIVTATLNQVETFHSSGVVPQNVNYALRTEFLFDLLRLEDAEASEPVRQEELSSANVVDSTEDSVFLIIARAAEE